MIATRCNVKMRFYCQFAFLLSVVLAAGPSSANDAAELAISDVEHPIINLNEERSMTLKIIGFVWGVFSKAQEMAKPTTQDLLDEIKEGFDKVYRELQDIKNTLDQIIGMIQDLAAQNAFREYELSINDSIFYYNKMMNMTTKAAFDQQRKVFVEKGSKLLDSIRHLLLGLLNESGAFSVDLLQHVIDRNDCHPRNVRKGVDEVMGLVNSGIYIMGAYSQVTRTSFESSTWDWNYLAELYNRTYTLAMTQIEWCRDETRVPGDLVKFMQANNYGSNHDMAHYLRLYLEDKYDTKYWAVIVCSDKGYRVSDEFRKSHGRKDAFAMSYAVNRTYSLSQSVISGIDSLSQDDYNSDSGFNALMNRVGWNSARTTAFGPNCDEGVGRNDRIGTHGRQNSHCERQWYCLWICKKCWDTFKARVIPPA